MAAVEYSLVKKIKQDIASADQRIGELEEKIQQGRAAERKLPQFREEVKRLVTDPDLWLDTPHEILGGRTPNEVIARGDPQRVRDLLRAIKYGVMA